MAHRTSLLFVLLLAGLAGILCVEPDPAAACEPEAQDTRASGRVRGQIVDARTGQPLDRVRIEIGRPISAPQESTLTDASGRFELSVAPGPITLTISVVGYILTKRDVVIDATVPLDLTIPLTEGTGSYTEEVRVMADRFPRMARGVPMEQTLGSADLLNLKSTIVDDPMRAVQALPGVAASDDFKSEFMVRGSDFRHVNVTLDGVPSPLLLHTVHQVSDSGSLAMINSDILDSVTLQSGSYPQRYGNHTGASVEFRTREGSRDRPHVRLSVSAINASGVAEGPIGRGRRGSWLISMRRSYMDWLVQRIDPTITGTFGFTDLHGTLAFDLSPSQTVMVSVVGGRSKFLEKETGRGLGSLDVGYNRAGLINASLRSAFSPSLVVTQRVYGVAGHFSNVNPLDLEIGRGDQRDLSYRADVNAVLRKGLLLEAGGHMQWLRGSGNIADFVYYESNGSAGNLIFSRRYDASAAWQSMYAHLRWDATPYLTITPGARLDHFQGTRETLLSPWLQAELLLPRSFMIAGGTGVFRQAPDLEQLFGPRGSSWVRSERAWHGDLGLGQRIGAWRWQAAAFVRDEQNVLRLPFTEPRDLNGRYFAESFLGRWENALAGDSHGVELMVHRRSARGLSGWIGYSYAATDYRDFYTGETFAGDADQRHTLNVYGSYRLSDRMNVSTRFRAGSNVPITGYYTNTGDRLFLSTTRNAVRLPAYSRLDLRGARTYAVSGGRLTLFVEVLNALNQGNVRATWPRINTRTLETTRVLERMFPILPSAGVSVEF
jgi:hypothetical protein